MLLSSQLGKKKYFKLGLLFVWLIMEHVIMKTYSWQFVYAIAEVSKCRQSMSVCPSGAWNFK